MMERRERADCTVSALACAAAVPYERAHAIATAAGRKRGCRFYARRLLAKAKAHGITFHKLPFTRRRTLARFLREYPTGRYYVNVRGHSLAVVDGVAGDRTPLTARVSEGWRLVAVGVREVGA